MDATSQPSQEHGVKAVSNNLTFSALQSFLMVPAKKTRGSYKSCNQYSVRKGGDVSDTADATEWTERLDTLLKQAVGSHGKNWTNVALYIKIHTMAQFNPPYVVEDGNLPQGLLLGGSGGGSGGSGGSGDSSDSSATMSLPALVSTHMGSTSTTSSTNCSMSKLTKRARIKANTKHTVSVIHHYPTAMECAHRWNTTYTTTSNTSSNTIPNTASNTTSHTLSSTATKDTKSYTATCSNSTSSSTTVNRLPQSASPHAAYTAYSPAVENTFITANSATEGSGSTAPPLLSVRTVQTLLATQHALLTTTPHTLTTAPTVTTYDGMSNSNDNTTTTAAATTCTASAVTMYNTTVERPWTDEEVVLLNEMIAQQQIKHHRLHSTLNNSINRSATSAITTNSDTSTTSTSDSSAHPYPTNSADSTVISNINTTTTTTTNTTTITDPSINNPFKINWPVIAATLNRTPHTIIKKYNILKQNTYKHGNFTKDEDIHIITRYLEWQCNYKNAKSGIWSLLERELNRKDKRISERWRHILSKRLGTLVKLDDNNNIVDPGNALKVWKAHQEEIRRFSSVNVYSVYSGGSGGIGRYGENTSNGGTDASSATDRRNVPPTITSSIYTPPSELRKRTLSTNSSDTNTSASANDNTMHEISNLLQTIHSDELYSMNGGTNNEYEVYGGSVWNSITNNTNTANATTSTQATYSTDTYSTYHANAVYGGSVWNSISNNASLHAHANAYASTNVHTTEHKTNNDSDSEIQELVLQGIIRWTDKLDKRLKEAVSRFPRDWAKVSEHMGIDCSSSKCRKRWARLQQKYQQTLSSAARGLRDAASFCFPEGCDMMAEMLGEGGAEMENSCVGIGGVVGGGSDGGSSGGSSDGSCNGGEKGSYKGTKCGVEGQLSQPHLRPGSAACVEMNMEDENNDLYGEMSDLGGNLDLDM